MSVTNPERVVTKQDLADFYTEIFPYLGGSVASGFTPVGTVIAVFAETAPTNYLVCDGATYNKADYPELAAHLLALTTHSQYEVSGDSTKFKVPDLRGEFLRGTGTNSHTNQGSGRGVGLHQDATAVDYNQTGYDAKVIRVGTTSDWSNPTKNGDGGFSVSGNGYIQITGTTAYKSTTEGYPFVNVRPTNTSVLFCIAVKNIVMGGGSSMNYSTDEQVVGTWINSKPIYQKTISITLPSTTTQTSVDLQVANIGDYYCLCPEGSYAITSDGSISQHIPIPTPWANTTSPYGLGCLISKNSSNGLLAEFTVASYWVSKAAYITVRYTKTTD